MNHQLDFRAGWSSLALLLILTVILLAPGEIRAGQEPAKRWLDAWRDTSPMLEVRSSGAYYAAGDVIHMIGGIGGSVVKGKVGADAAASTTKMFMRSSEYARVRPDGSLSSWKRGPQLNMERGFFSAAAHNGHLYVVGGANGPFGSSLLDSVERARIRPDGTLDKWVLEKNRLNIARRCVKLAVIGNYIYAFGGFGGILLDTVERAEIRPDGTLGEWLVANDRMTTARYISGVERIGDGIYVIGGHNKDDGAGITDVEWSKPDSDGFFNPWSKRNSLQTGRYGLATATHNGFIYALGGLSGAAYLDSIEMAHTDSEGQLSAWRYTSPMPSPREGATSFVLNGNIYLVGGSNRSGFQNSVSYATFNEKGEIGYLATPAEIEQHQARVAKARARAKQTKLPHEGTITEHIKMAQYSYIHVKMDDGTEVWLAAPVQNLDEGARIEFPNGTVMKNFRSNSLNRNFPFIVFIGEVRKVAASPAK